MYLGWKASSRFQALGCSGFRVQGFGFGVRGLGFRVLQPSTKVLSFGRGLGVVWGTMVLSDKDIQGPCCADTSIIMP